MNFTRVTKPTGFHISTRKKLKPFALKKKSTPHKRLEHPPARRKAFHHTLSREEMQTPPFCAQHHPDLGSDVVRCAKSSPSASPKARSSAPPPQRLRLAPKQLVSELHKTRSKWLVLTSSPLPGHSAARTPAHPSPGTGVQVSIAIPALIRHGQNTLK